jgi:hypothetical protein
MKTLVPLLAALVLATASLHAAAGLSTASTNWAPATAPEILVEGRCVKTASGSVRLGFPGATLHLRGHATRFAIRVNASSDEVYFDVQTDGAEPMRLRCHSGEGEYILLERPAVADHMWEITRRSESWQGACEILGFQLADGGQLLPPDPLPEHKLMFIGDSITCGAATDIRPNDPLQGKTAHEEQTSNARLSFGKILARRLHAQCHLVSYGGRGVIRDWQGLLTVRNAPQFYELALPDDPTIAWNPADYVPDAIVICLGTNDFNQGVPDEKEFVNAYVEFVGKVRRDAPRAKVFLADSPIVYDAPGKVPKRSVLHAYLLEVVEKVNSPEVLLAPVSHYVGVPNNGHPTREDHEAIANELEPLLREALHWN